MRELLKSELLVNSVRRGLEIVKYFNKEKRKKIRKE